MGACPFWTWMSRAGCAWAWTLPPTLAVTLSMHGAAADFRCVEASR